MPALARRAVAVLGVLALALTLTPMAEGAAGAPGRVPADSSAGQRVFRVQGGVLMNNPKGTRYQKYRINVRLAQAIDHTRRGSVIKILSWNVMSYGATDHLLAAQRRGVIVRVLMAADNISRAVPNPQFARLRRGLAAGNHRTGHRGFSQAKVCHKSCRGPKGQAHAKYYLFSKTGASKHVVMEGSANYTVAAAINQWNDMYTWVGNAKMYRFAKNVFDQSWRDRPVAKRWVQHSSGTTTLAFSPIGGSDFHGVPEQKVLKAVRCAGAVHGNSRHRTVIRMFPDVIKQRRGILAAQLLRRLWNQGCDIKIGYTVMGRQVHRILASHSGRGPVPMRHLAVDRDGDGEFEMYFHLKVLTVNGVVGGDRAAFRLVQGSSNIANDSSTSDENYGIFTGRSIVRRYQRQLEQWWNHPPIGHRVTGRYALRTADGRLAATGPDGYIAPGTLVVSPTTGKLVDPYALIDQD